MITEGIILKTGLLSEYIYTLKLIWLLTDKDLVNHQLKQGYSKNQLIDKLEDAVNKSELSKNLSDVVRKQLTESIFFIIEKRVNECSKS
ncbi:hypothetical protein [Hafnia alvei]|uniref:hypothetical protein n=1 Tax=Hafnia alvei TaxID=569 RepID=UPI00345EC87A